MWYAEAKRIYVLPLGKVSFAVTETVREALSAAFKDKDIVVGEEIPLPRYAYDMERQQCLSSRVLREFASMGLDGMVLGVVEVDLYVPGLNFVFGEADPEDGNALISLTRMRQEFYGKPSDEGLFLERTAKEAVHEIGHLFGLRHCPDERCVMHFSNEIEETDIKDVSFCPACKNTISAVDLP